MWLKLGIIIAFLFIIISLARALFFLIRDGGKSSRMIKALTWRIGLSIALFLFIIVAYEIGWLKPNNFPMNTKISNNSAGQDKFASAG